MEINGHKLPDELYELIKDNDDKPFISVAALQPLVPEGVMVAGGFIGGLRFFSVEGIKGEMQNEVVFSSDQMEKLYCVVSSQRSGKPIDDLHILDVDKALHIAGNMDEETIALDYRVDPLNPRVLGSFHPKEWVLLADSFAEFAKKVDL